MFGGAWSNGWRAGAFCVELRYGSDMTSRNTDGVALSCKPYADNAVK